MPEYVAFGTKNIWACSIAENENESATNISQFNSSYFLEDPWDIPACVHHSCAVTTSHKS